MNLMAKLAERETFLNKQTLGAALEEMAVLAAKAIEPGRKRRLQPLHPRHEVSLRGFEREVKVDFP